MRRRTRKAQMELLGLAIIVVIVSLGMFYVLTFVASKPPRLIHSKFMEKELAQNMLGSTLKAEAANCLGLTLGDLLQDCGNYEHTRGSIRCADGNLSCQYAENEMSTLLNKTLGSWAFSYRFRAFTHDPQNPLIPSQRYLKEVEQGKRLFNHFNPWNCTDIDDKEAPGVQPLPLDGGGTLMITLEICK